MIVDEIMVRIAISSIKIKKEKKENYLKYLRYPDIEYSERNCQFFMCVMVKAIVIKVFEV